MKLGKSAEAGVAFREAALDEGNPDPTKALLNLGVCFMALDRPADAVASYESALQFDMTARHRSNKLYANLGQAYVASRPDAEGRERLRGVHRRQDVLPVRLRQRGLPARHRRAVAQGTSELTQVIPGRRHAPAGHVRARRGGRRRRQCTPTQDPYALRQQDPYYYDDALRAEPAVPRHCARTARRPLLQLPPTKSSSSGRSGLAKQDRKRRNVGLKMLVVSSSCHGLAAVRRGRVRLHAGLRLPHARRRVAKELFADPGRRCRHAVLRRGRATERRGHDSSSLVTDSERHHRRRGQVHDASPRLYVTAKTERGRQRAATRCRMVRDMIGWKVSQRGAVLPEPELEPASCGRVRTVSKRGHCAVQAALPRPMTAVIIQEPRKDNPWQSRRPTP